jgi:hypothetical protein
VLSETCAIAGAETNKLTMQTTFLKNATLVSLGFIVRQ